MKVLFVCTANICRSALAEAILKKRLQERGHTDIVVSSAGVCDYAGRPRDETMSTLARLAGYDMDDYARYASQEVVESADLIICMEHFHVVEIQKRLPYVRWNCIHLFNEICFGEQTNLIDPTGDTDDIYQYAFDKIQSGCEVLTQKLEKMC